jgi:hypothetical protein
MRLLLLLVCTCTWVVPASAQTAESDPVTPLLGQFEQALNGGDRSAMAAVFAANFPAERLDQYRSTLLMPGSVKTTLRERDRAQLEGAPPGDGYSLVVEFFIETLGRARILTAAMDMRRPSGGGLASWRFVGAESLTFVEGLYKLGLGQAINVSSANIEQASLRSISGGHFPGEDHLVPALKATNLYTLDNTLGRGQRRLSLSAA